MNSTLTKTVFFAAQPATVWAFLTDKEKLGLWYHPARENLVEGEEYALTAADESKTLIWGRVVEMTPPSKLVTTMCMAPFGDNETTVTWLLEPVVDGTRLTLIHEGIAEAVGPAAINVLSALDVGWDDHFSQLRSAVNG